MDGLDRWWREEGRMSGGTMMDGSESGVCDIPSPSPHVPSPRALFGAPWISYIRRVWTRFDTGDTFEDNCGSEDNESRDRIDFSIEYIRVLVSALSTARLTWAIAFDLRW